jgi:hypothetical protein
VTLAVAITAAVLGTLSFAIQVYRWRSGRW